MKKIWKIVKKQAETDVPEGAGVDGGTEGLERAEEASQERLDDVDRGEGWRGLAAKRIAVVMTAQLPERVEKPEEPEEARKMEDVIFFD